MTSPLLLLVTTVRQLYGSRTSSFRAFELPSYGAVLTVELKWGRIEFAPVPTAASACGPVSEQVHHGARADDWRWRSRNVVDGRV
jgi:hypothetical protein